MKLSFKKKFGYLLKNNESFDFWTDPLLYCISNSKECKPQTMIFILQNELHSLLNSFFDPLELPNKNKVFYPFIDSLPSYINFRLPYLLEFLIKLNFQFDFNTSITFLKKNQEKMEPKPFGKFLSIIYDELDQNINNINLKVNKRKIFCDTINNAEYNNVFLKPILLLRSFSKKNLTKFFKDFLLHGSLSTLDYVYGWSDVDTYAIIKNDVIKNWKKILQLREIIFKLTNFFFMIDAYQHHGIFLCTEIDTLFYPQTYLPFCVLEISKSLFQSSELEFMERNEKIETMNELWKAVQVIRKAYVTNFPLRNYYFFKLYLGYVLLLPTYYLQAKGVHVYKKYSFEKAKKDFDSENWKVMDKAELFRKNCARKQILPLQIRKKVVLSNPFLNLFPFYFLKNNAPDQFLKISETFIKNVLLLSEMMLERIKSKRNLKF